jgi:hypothetical protein
MVKVKLEEQAEEELKLSKSFTKNALTTKKTDRLVNISQPNQLDKIIGTVYAYYIDEHSNCVLSPAKFY